MVTSRVIPVSRQPDYFRTYIEKLEEANASNIIEDSLVLISSGNNDVTFNYCDGPTRRFQFPSIGGYHDFLQNRLQDFVKVNPLSPPFPSLSSIIFKNKFVHLYIVNNTLL